MKDTTCMCGRVIPKEAHTGECQLNYWLSYMCGVVDKENGDDLRRIVGVIASEKEELVPTLNKRYAAALEIYDEFARTTRNVVQYSPFYRWCQERLNATKKA